MSTAYRALSAAYHPLSTIHEETLPVIRRLMRCCWWLVKLGVLGTIIGTIIAVPALYRRVDEEIRHRVEERFAQHYPGLTVSVHSAQLREGEGIEVRGLRFSEPDAEGPRAELLEVEEVFLSCQGKLEELIRGEPEIKRILVRRPHLRATHNADGTWSTSALLPLPQFSQQAPTVVIEAATVEFVDPVKSPPAKFTVRDLNFVLAPPEETPQPAPGMHLRKLQGTLTGDFLRQVAFEGLVDPHGTQWTIAGTTECLEMSPELRDALSQPLADKLTELGSLRGQVRLAFRLTSDPAVSPPFRYDVSGQLSQGSLDDARLPHPLTDLRASFRVSNGGIAVDGLSAVSGPTLLRVPAYRRAGFTPQSPQWLEAEVRELELDRRLLEVLPDSLRNRWYDYLPAGRIHASLKLAYDGRTWQPELAVQCVNVSYSYHKFPYRLQQGKGSLTLKDGALQVNLTAYSGSEPVQVSGRILQPMTAPVGKVEVWGDSIPIDDKLLSALPGKSRSVIQSLNPYGALKNVYGRFWRDKPEEPWRKELKVRVEHCGIRYEKFAYPLTEIQGRLDMLDDHWTFSELSGVNDTGFVTCNGQLDPLPEGEGGELLLNFTGTNIALDEELRDALDQPNMQQVWNDLRLRGMVDLNAKIAYRTGQSRPQVGFTAEFHSENTSIEPMHFPYRLEKLRGVMEYRDGLVTVDKLRAEHGPTTLTSAARCTFLPDGSWHLCLERLSVDRLHLDDREFMQALPQRVKQTIVGLAPNGPTTLTGTFEFARGGQPGDPLTSRWDLDLGFCQGSVDFGLKLENLNGGMKLVGDFDGQRFQSRGELDLQSVGYRNLQFIGVKGPFWIDDEQVLFGSEVDRFRRSRPDGQAADQAPRPLTGQLFGGTLYGNGWVALGRVPRYELNATLSQADLSRCAQEMLPGPQNLSGQILATVSLRGAGRSLNSLSGNGSIHLRNADIYELPVMISLLKILSIREPDRTAFSESDIRFRVEGPHLYLDPINFSGDAISLEGKGELDLQTNVRLRFRAQLGRNELHLPVLREVLGGASEQILILHVEGTLQDPVTRREPFPVVNQALQGLRSDQNKPTNSPGLFPQVRRWKPDEWLRMPKKQ
ncbi:MAG: AsmA-like C-terminal region-containing protein [Thermoguttaceae bacterium]